MNKSLRVLAVILCFIVLMCTFMACTKPADNVEIEEENKPQEYIEEEDIEISQISITEQIDSITFGKYPQTITPDIHVAIDQDYNGYYLGTDRNLYAPKDGSYYKVEDVVWDAFKLESGDILLVSQKILFTARFDDYHDYFERERQVFDFKGFIFTDEESAKIKYSGVEYGYNVTNSAKFKTRMFFLNIDAIMTSYPSAQKVLKKPTDYCINELEVSEYGYATWWIAPEHGKNYYISLEGTISNKNNTYLGYLGNYPSIRYSVRGIAPAMVISAN